MSAEKQLSIIRQMRKSVPESGTDDVAPALLEQIQQFFEELYRHDSKIAAILEKIEAGTATHLDTQAYAARIGDLASSSMLAKLNSGVLPDGKMYYNIAQRTIMPTLETGHSLINDVAAEVEKELRKRAGIGVKVKLPDMDTGRAKALINKVCQDVPFDEVSYVLDEPVKNTMQSFADDFIRENAETLQRVGMRPKITRRVVGDCCKWCLSLAGTYNYGDEPKPDFYRRHDFCRCAVIYDPGTGRIKDYHSKKIFRTETELIDDRARMSKNLRSFAEQKRRVIGLKSGDVTIRGVSNHAVSRMFSREISMEALKDAVSHPIYVGAIKEDSKGRRSIEFVGEKATFALNPDIGNIVTVHATHTKLARKLKEGLK